MDEDKKQKGVEVEEERFEPGPVFVKLRTAAFGECGHSLPPPSRAEALCDAFSYHYGSQLCVDCVAFRGIVYEMERIGLSPACVFLSLPTRIYSSLAASTGGEVLVLSFINAGTVILLLVL